MTHRTFLTLCFLLVAISGSTRNFNAVKNANQLNNSKAGALHSPLGFLENKGQITDQNAQPRNDIQFNLKAAKGLNIFIGNGAIHYQFVRADANLQPTVVTMDKHNRAQLLQKRKYTSYRMDVELAGADPNAKAIAEDVQNHTENYVRRGQTLTAHTYSRIVYKDVYSHIDWVLYTANGTLKHEFIVKAGGRVSDIKLKYSGASSLKLNEDNSLTAVTPQGSVTEEAPKSFTSDGQMVPSKFVLKGDILSYETGAWTGDLVIDPTLAWGTYFGDTSEDAAYDVAADASGNAYIAGFTYSAIGIATSGAHLTTYMGAEDAFLAKFNSAGVLQWATYFGEMDPEYANAVSTDNSGNVYMAGKTTSGLLATPGAYQTSPDGGYNGFLAKFNGAGVLQWSTYYGGNSNDEVFGVATDGTGNVYITGSTESATGIATPGAYQTAYGGGTNDAFLAKFDSSGTIQWSTYLGNIDNEQGFDVATDASGNAYIAGSHNSSSDEDAFVAKFTAAGALSWNTGYGGTWDENASSISVDAAGNAYITGVTSSAAGIATPGTHQTTHGGGGWDGYLAKFSSAGVMQWGTYFGGSGVERGYGVVADNTGNVFVTGYTESSAGIATAGAYQSVLAGPTDAFLAQFSGMGALLWSTYYGGPSRDHGNGIARDGSGNVYFGGSTNSTSAIATSGAHQGTFGGGFNDAFLARFSFCTPPAAGIITGVDTVCIGNSITLSNSTAGGTWSASNGNATATGGTITGVTAGTVTISYTVANSCGSNNTTKQVYVKACINDVEQINPGQTLTIMPNPANSNVVIESSAPIHSVVATNTLGQTVYFREFNASSVIVNLEHLPPGLYFIKVNNGKAYKLIKQ